MHNFPANIDGCAEGFQCDFDNVNRAHHSRAKSARLEQQHPLLTGGSLGAVTVRDGIKSSCSHTTSIPTAAVKQQGSGIREPASVEAVIHGLLSAPPSASLPSRSV